MYSHGPVDNVCILTVWTIGLDHQSEQIVVNTACFILGTKRYQMNSRYIIMELIISVLTLVITAGGVWLTFLQFRRGR